MRLETDLTHHSGYPRYRRLPREVVEGTPWDNTWVVPYNTWLLKKYQAHINVEACTNAKPVAYLYKYIFKGSDSADVSTTTTLPSRSVNQPRANRNKNEVPVDEVSVFHYARWICSCEPAWRILGLPIGEIKPPVTRLQLPLENQQRTVLDPEKTTAASLLTNEKIRRTTLTDSFEMNRLAQEAEAAGDEIPFRNAKEHVVDPREFSYSNIPEHFVWKKKDKRWSVRGKGQCLGRMYLMTPKSGDLFYLRLLLANRKGATSFEALRTVPVQVLGAPAGVEEQVLTYKQACVELGLTDDDGKWYSAMTEATEFGTAAMLRGLLTTILTECGLAEPRRPWDTHKAA